MTPFHIPLVWVLLVWGFTLLFEVSRSPAENCVDYYIGETACRVNERIVDHTGRDIDSHLLKHSIESGYKPLEAVDYKIIGTVYRKNTMKRKFSEALIIKELKRILNKQEKSLPLKLFN